MAQQTAVEWLHIEFQKRFPKETYEMYVSNQLLYEDMIIQAKAMHVEEIKNAYITGIMHPLEIEATKQAEEYYNETFHPDHGEEPKGKVG